MAGSRLGAFTTATSWMTTAALGGYVPTGSLNPAIPETSGNPSPSSTMPSLPGLGRVTGLPGEYGQDGHRDSLSSASLRLITMLARGDA